MLGIIRKEDGAITIIVAILLVVIIGFSALVIDIGHLYQVRRQLQSAADAAALAAAQEIIKGGDELRVSTVADTYAKKNDFNQDLGTIRELEMVYPSEMTKFEAEYAKVTVKKNVALFLAPIFSLLASGNFTDRTIYAQAKAEVVFVTGGTGLVPWGVPIVRARKVEAEVNGITSELLKNTSTGRWEGSLILPNVSNVKGYAVKLTYFNSQSTSDFPDGFPESLLPSAYIGIHNNNDPIADVYFSDGFVSPGGSTFLFVESSEAPRARVGNTNYNSFTSAGTGLWATEVTSPSSVDSITQLNVDVSVGNGVDTFNLYNAAVLSVRRSTFPIKNVEFTGGTHFNVGEANATNISVELNDFIYGIDYELKVVAGPESGNFSALDFRYVFHPSTDPPSGYDEGENTSGADYYDNIILYSGDIHIGDIIGTSPGNLSGPTTVKQITERIGSCNMTWAEWNLLKPPCGRVIIAPVVEKIERLNGRSEVVVESISSFFISEYENDGGGNINITGRFIETFMAGDYTTTKPDTNLYMETVRLTTTDF